MVRTKASNAAPAATRKAVAARAPRKSVGVPRPVCSPSPSGRSKKGKSVIGGNPARLWGTPEWQKGIGGFLKGGEGSSSSSMTFDPEQQEPGPSTEPPQEAGSEAVCSGLGTASGSGGVAFLDSSIAQLNSDDEDSD